MGVLLRLREYGTASVRRECVVEGCSNLQRSKGRTRSGVLNYDNYCNFHHKLKYTVPDGEGLFKISKKYIENKKCVICGWDKGPCDRHRLDNTKGYEEGNVKILCPNCHRLVTLGIVSVEEPVKIPEAIAPEVKTKTFSKMLNKWI